MNAMLGEPRKASWFSRLLVAAALAALGAVAALILERQLRNTDLIGDYGPRIKDMERRILWLEEAKTRELEKGNK